MMMQVTLAGEKAKPPPEFDVAVGFAWFFENIVFYCSAQDLIGMLHDRKANRYGDLLGAVIGLIPRDPYQVLYEWLIDSKGYKKRKAERKILTNLGLSRYKMRIMKTHGQTEIANNSHR